tara:strand:+ start:902 stop:1051 length:150 start_codon:yes stop_codon:yes gene_type:complete
MGFTPPPHGVGSFYPTPAGGGVKLKKIKKDLTFNYISYIIPDRKRGLYE